MKTNPMKIRSLLACVVFALSVSCAPEEGIGIEITNPLDQPQPDAAILLTRGEISSWAEIPEGKVPALYNKKGEPVPCQADDLNSDGTWDELFGLTDLPAGGRQVLSIRFVDQSDLPAFETRTNLRLGAADHPGFPELTRASRLSGVGYHNYGGVTGSAFQMEGPAWENDKVGFRNYFDQRNGMDIFGKMVPEMVLDSVGIPGSSSYHEPAAWGMDILKVGTSLGAGAIGYMIHDSIYRVGDNGAGTYEALFEGPQRSRFKLSYTGWSISEETVDVDHQIEITAGRHYYQGSVTYSGTESKMALVPGIVNINSDRLHVVEASPDHSALITLDAQAEDGSMLAMALLVPSSVLMSHGEAPEQGEGVTQTYYAVLDAAPEEVISYRFYSLWEKEDPRWASLNQVVAYLESEAAVWSTQVDIAARH